MRRPTRGFAVVELVIVLVIVGLLGFIAWRLILSNKQPAAAPSQEAVVSNETVPAVKNTSDLDTLSTDLDAIEIDDGITTDQLEIESAF